MKSGASEGVIDKPAIARSSMLEEDKCRYSIFSEPCNGIWDSLEMCSLVPLFRANNCVQDISVFTVAL